MNRMVKAKKEEKIKQSIQYKEAFIKLLKNCKEITAESTSHHVEQLLGNTETWQKMDKKERDDEIYNDDTEIKWGLNPHQMDIALNTKDIRQ